MMKPNFSKIFVLIIAIALSCPVIAGEPVLPDDCQYMIKITKVTQENAGFSGSVSSNDFSSIMKMLSNKSATGKYGFMEALAVITATNAADESTTLKIGDKITVKIPASKIGNLEAGNYVACPDLKLHTESPTWSMSATKNGRTTNMDSGDSKVIYMANEPRLMTEELEEEQE